LVVTDPRWLELEDVTQFPNAVTRDWLKKKNKYSIVKQYSAESIGGAQTDAINSLSYTNLALWLSGMSEVSYPVIYHVESHRNQATFRQAFSMPRFYQHVSDPGVKAGRKVTAKARDYNKALLSLSAKSPVFTAAIILRQALRDRLWHSRYLSIWICLEALFGPKSGGELKYRISTRLAQFIGKSEKTRKNIYNHAKLGYDIRSAIVHGMGSSNAVKRSSKPNKFLYQTEDLLRHSLCIILSDSKKRDIFTGDDREPYLDNLQFNSHRN
jgi:hypothetical protein